MRFRDAKPHVSHLMLAIAADDIGLTAQAIAHALDSITCGDFMIAMWLNPAFSSDALRARPRYPELLRAMGR